MAGNIFGRILTLTSFGESHGKAIGGVLDGFPAGVLLDMARISNDMSRRKPGQSALVTQRKEEDRVDILSGVFEGKTTGAPIAFVIANQDTRPADYDHLKDVYRPGHADYTYDIKYGFRDHRGGGRSSARETAVRVAAGAIAKQLLPNTSIIAFVSSVGDIDIPVPYTSLDLAVPENMMRCPHADTATKMESLIEQVRNEGDTVGGVITCVVQGAPPGLGEPVFAKLHAKLGQAMLTINAAKGFEMGNGFEGARMRGSIYHEVNNTNAGGVLGGITTGQDLVFRVAFKPVSTLMQTRLMPNKASEMVKIAGKGRHDPCVVPRAVPIVEAMAALVLADFYLLNKIYQQAI